MNIPPFDLTHIANDDGTPHPKFKQLMDMLITEMNKNFSNEGNAVPAQNTATIKQLNTPQSKSNMLYNSQTNQFVGNVNGTYMAFQMTAMEE